MDSDFFFSLYFDSVELARELPSLSSSLLKLTTFKNKAFRIVAGTHFREPAGLKILKVDELHKYKIAKVFLCYIRNKNPSYVSDFFVKASQVSSKATRQ